MDIPSKRLKMEDFTPLAFQRFFRDVCESTSVESRLPEAFKYLADPEIETTDVLEWVRDRYPELTPFETVKIPFTVEVNFMGEAVLKMPDPENEGNMYPVKAEAIIPFLEWLIENHEKEKHVKCVSRSFVADAVKQRIKDEEEMENSPDYGFVYLLASQTGFYKIGKSKDPSTRINTLGVQLPFAIETTALIECANRHTAERMLHSMFQDKRQGGEWFALTEDDVLFIKSIYMIGPSDKIHRTKKDIR